MRKFFFPFTLLAMLTFAAGGAQAQDKIEVFGGYSYVHAQTHWDETLLCPVGIIPCPATVVGPKLNLNGWEFSGLYKPKEWLGLGADISGQYGSFNGASYHLQTYLFGPQISLPGKVSPFAHVFVGGAHATSGSGFAPNSVLVATGGSPNNGFAAELGVGIDVKIAPFIWIRPVQIDYLATRLSQGNSSTQSQPRVSAGLVFHF